MMALAKIRLLRWYVALCDRYPAMMVPSMQADILDAILAEVGPAVRERASPIISRARMSAPCSPPWTGSRVPYERKTSFG